MHGCCLFTEVKNSDTASLVTLYWKISEEFVVETIIEINDFVNGIVWGVSIMLLILGTGIYYSIRLKFIQFRHSAGLVRQTIVKAFQKRGRSYRTRKAYKFPGSNDISFRNCRLW